jgi:hypothetical protein
MRYNQLGSCRVDNCQNHSSPSLSFGSLYPQLSVCLIGQELRFIISTRIFEISLCETGE